MSTTIAAFLAAMLATGMSSAISHPLTLVGGGVAAVMMGVCAMVQTDAKLHMTFIFGSLGMAVLALLSAEANHSADSSAIHVLCCYLALMSMGFSSARMSSFCNQTIFISNIWLTGWVIYHGTQTEAFRAWQISNPASAGNLMAAQINMTMPLVIAGIVDGPLYRRLASAVLLCLNMLAVVLVMSRNGIGAMLVLLTLYVMFNHKRLSCFVIAGILFVAMFPEYLLRNPTIRALLIRFRFIDFDPEAPRSLIWDVALQYVSESPALGVGPGRTKVALAILDTNHAHNNLIQVATETGIPSACLYLIMTGVLLMLPAFALFRVRQVFLPTLGILAYVAYSLTAGPLVFPNATLLLAACVNQARVAADWDRSRTRALDLRGRGDMRSRFRAVKAGVHPGYMRSAG
ncbi:MAG: O-antigen ligase family protein [Planctomycetaceae bacterium]